MRSLRRFTPRDDILEIHSKFAIIWPLIILKAEVQKPWAEGLFNPESLNP